MDEAVDLIGNANERIHGLAIADAGKLQGDGEAEIGDERKRMRGIDGERSEQRENLAQKLIFEPGPFLPSQFQPIDQHDPVLAKRLAQLAPALLLIARKHRHRLGDAHELLARGKPIRRPDRNAGSQLAFEAGHADHEEFVEIVRRDREKAYPLEQGLGVVAGFFQNPAVELQPRQLSISKAFWARLKVERGDGLAGWLRRSFLQHYSDLAAIRHGSIGSCEEQVGRP